MYMLGVSLLMLTYCIIVYLIFIPYDARRKVPSSNQPQVSAMLWTIIYIVKVTSCRAE